MAITGAYLIYGFCKVGLQFKIAQLIHEKEARRNANMKKIDLQNKFIFWSLSLFPEWFYSLACQISTVTT